MWVFVLLGNGTRDVGRLDAYCWADVSFRRPLRLTRVGGDVIVYNPNVIVSMKEVDEATARRMAKQFGHQPAGVTAGYDEEGF